MLTLLWTNDAVFLGPPPGLWIELLGGDNELDSEETWTPESGLKASDLSVIRDRQDTEKWSQLFHTVGRYNLKKSHFNSCLSAVSFLI